MLLPSYLNFAFVVVVFRDDQYSETVAPHDSQEKAHQLHDTISLYDLNGCMYFVMCAYTLYSAYAVCEYVCGYRHPRWDLVYYVILCEPVMQTEGFIKSLTTVAQCSSFGLDLPFKM